MSSTHPILAEIIEAIKSSNNRITSLSATSAPGFYQEKVAAAIKNEKYFQAQITKQQAELTRKITFFSPESAKKTLLTTANLLKLSTVYETQFNNLQTELSLYLRKQNTLNRS